MRLISSFQMILLVTATLAFRGHPIVRPNRFHYYSFYPGYKVCNNYLLSYPASFTLIHAKKWLPTKLLPNKRKRSVTGSSVETALILTSPARCSDFKETMHHKFPLVPTPVLDVCLDSLADIFSRSAPAVLQEAMEPGGITKMRPELEDKMVRIINDRINQVGSLPPVIVGGKKSGALGGFLPESTLRYLVNVALDYALGDLEELMADPYHKLMVLEEERRAVTKYMSRRQLVWYEIRYHTLRSVLVSSVTALLGMLLYLQYRHHYFVIQALKRCEEIWSVIVGASSIFSTFVRVNVFDRLVVLFTTIIAAIKANKNRFEVIWSVVLGTCSIVAKFVRDVANRFVVLVTTTIAAVKANKLA